MVPQVGSLAAALRDGGIKMADSSNNGPWVTIVVAAISAAGAIGAAMVVRGGSEAPKAAVSQPEIQAAASLPAVTAGAPAVTQAATTPAETVAQPQSTAAPAASSTDWRAQVLGFLDTQHKPLIDAGYARDTGADDWVGLLKVGTPKVWEVQLVRGVDYQVVGVCDSDCKDVDMEIYDPSGAKVGGDTLVDDFPRVQFRPAVSGAHTVKVWLRNCASADGTQSCVVAARILRR
jgi:hypothetical protein